MFVCACLYKLFKFSVLTFMLGIVLQNLCKAFSYGTFWWGFLGTKIQLNCIQDEYLE